MNVSYAIEGYLTFIKEDLLSDFSEVMIDGYVYDESLDFNSRASSFIRKQQEFQKTEGTPITDWSFIAWNRGSLESGQTNRPMRISVATGGDDEIIDAETTVKMATLSIEIKVFTNNVELAETIEEYIHVLSGELVSFEADYQSLGIMRCSAVPSTTTTFEKEELEEVGSTIGIGLSSIIHFPVILPTKAAKRIEHIHNIIWDGLNFDDINKIEVANDWILTEPPII